MNTTLHPRSSSLAAALALVCGLVAAGPSAAANITYHVDQSIDGGSVTGTLVTDGDLGVLDSSDIVSFNLVLQGMGSVSMLSSSSAGFEIAGGDLMAQGNQLLFNFSGSDNGYMLFQKHLFSGTNYWCNAVSGAVCLMGSSVVPRGYKDGSAQFDSTLTGLQVLATTNVSTVPEPATWALLLAGVGALGFTSRRKRGDALPALAA